MGAYDSFLSRIPKVDEAPETNPELAKRLEQAQLAYKEQFGKELPVTRRVSTRKEQKDLYNRNYIALDSNNEGPSMQKFSRFFFL